MRTETILGRKFSAEVTVADSYNSVSASNTTSSYREDSILAPNTQPWPGIPVLLQPHAKVLVLGALPCLAKAPQICWNPGVEVCVRQLQPLVANAWLAETVDSIHHRTRQNRDPEIFRRRCYRHRASGCRVLLRREASDHQRGAVGDPLDRQTHSNIRRALDRRTACAALTRANLRSFPHCRLFTRTSAELHVVVEARIAELNKLDDWHWIPGKGDKGA